MQFLAQINSESTRFSTSSKNRLKSRDQADPSLNAAESTCNFNSINCKGIIRQITNNTEIPIIQKEFISVGMRLC